MSDTPISEPLAGRDETDYRLDAPGEIAAWLRELLQSQARVQLATPEGHSIHSVLAAVDTPHGMLTLEAPADGTALHTVLASDELVATAYLDRIKLQFDLPGLLRVQAARAEVLRAPLPRLLYRFQRRQAYRVTSTGRLYPALKLENGQRLRVLNLSAGGLALQWPLSDQAAAPRAGDLINSATLELEREVNFMAQLRVQHVGDPADLGEAADSHLSLGCAFASLSPTATRALQLYIDQAQKRERLLKKS